MDRPSIWLVNPYGPLPGEKWREYRFATLGRILAGAGCDVTWWTAGFSHHFKVHRSREWMDSLVGPNFHVRLVPTPGYRRHVGLGRLLFEFVFACRLERGARHARRPDFIIASDTPQVSAFVAARLCRRFGAMLIVDVMDLWPELFDLAIPRPLRSAARPLFWPWRALRRSVRRRAHAITALCPSYLRHALREARGGIESRVIYNGIDVGGFRAQGTAAQSRVEDLFGRSKAPREIWAVFAGTVGNNYDVDCLASAAKIVEQDQPLIRIWIAGDGPLCPRLREAGKSGSGNLQLLGRLDHQSLASLYRHCDVGLCTYARDSNVEMPDKAYDYLAAGLPIITSLRGDLREVIESKGVGLSYEPGNAQSLAAALRTVARDEVLRKRLADNAYRCGNAFDRAGQYAQMLDLLRALGLKQGIPESTH
ncbi:MAG: glycosyltransferase family 4 protein [Acidobacteria bacterium]|nr:glycosyltransferase family 4 protein [Acidobacteriota bacterium]